MNKTVRKKTVNFLGLYAESHGVVHNSIYDLEKDVGAVDQVDDYYVAQSHREWWDNGAEPIWITAVKQV